MTHRSKSTLFLIEQLIVIAVFAICAVACISILTAAYFNANDSRDISHALLKAESGAEVFKATGGDVTAAAEILGGTGRGGFRASGESEISVFYDKNWQVCEAGDASFMLVLYINAAEGRNMNDILLTSGTLTVERITGEELVAFKLTAVRRNA